MNKRRSKTKKRIMAFLLCIAMMMSSLSVAATEGSEIVEATEIGVVSETETATEVTTQATISVGSENEEIPVAESVSAEENSSSEESSSVESSSAEVTTEAASTVESTSEEESVSEEESTTEEESVSEEETTTEEESVSEEETTTEEETLPEKALMTLKSVSEITEMEGVKTVYNFCDGSIVPTDTDGKATVSSADEKLTVACGPNNAYAYNGEQHGCLFKTNNTITIAVPEKAKISIGGCQYTKADATVTFTMDGTDLNDTISTKTETCYHQDGAAVVYDYEGKSGDLVLTFAEQTYVPVITVVRTEPKPDKTEVTANITINDEDELLGDSKITLVNESDATDVVDVTKGGKVTLKVNATYDIVSDNADIAAKAKNIKTVVTTTEDLDVTIDITSTVVNPIVSIVDTDGVLGNAELTLTNQADAEEILTLTDGETVKLTIGATYKLNCTEASITATVSGSTLLKVAEDLVELTVDVIETDTTKHVVDVWDFGAEQLADTEYIDYNNRLTKDIINSWYKDITAGTKGPNIAAFEVLDESGNVELAFNDGGYTTAHRLRSTNADITRYDDKSLKDIEDSNIIYSGYIYSNKGATADVNFKVAAKAGDIFTFIISSNGSKSDLTWTAPSGATNVKTYEGKSSNAQKMTFYAAEDGYYTIHSATEKLVVARIYRERPDVITVSGKVTAPAEAKINGAVLEFTNQTTGVVTEAKIADGKYEVSLSEQYRYDIKLSGANGYIVDENNSFAIKNAEGKKNFNVNIIAVDLVNVTGSLADLTTKEAKNLKLEFISDNVFIPELVINADEVTYSATLEQGVKYEVKESGVEDYALETTTVKVEKDGTLDIVFKKKSVYDIEVKVEGVSAEEAESIKLTFNRLNEEYTADGYTYSFIGTEGVSLRDGQYKVIAELTGYTQGLTPDVKVNGKAQTITIVMNGADQKSVPYKAEISVGTNGDYKTINEALEAVRNMERSEEERVVIAIEPGNYEEMLVIDVENITLKNASANPSIELTNKGVDIAEGAVRITSYYGHGYTYYSMGSDCKYDEELLAVNKENGYPSFENPGSGTTAGSYWNATVVVTASGFEADGIIFENSFNQYVSEKAANDIIVKQGAAKEGSKARADMEAGDVTVQNKAYVERAAALAMYNSLNDIVFDNCKFVGRQDTLYGGTNTYVEFNKCSIYGGTDYIFGGMIAIFNKCDLVFNTSEDKNDVGYITAAQQKSGRGYLMYECHITSTTPGVDTASAYTSKPGYLGRPWQADTSEVIFYNTTIDAADAHWASTDSSLIAPIGWNNSLSGESAGMCEYGTIEKSGADNSANRVAWATVLTSPVMNDGTEISLEAFRREIPEENPSEGGATSTTTEFVLDTTADLTAFAQGAKVDGDSEKAGTEDYFTLIYSVKTKVDSSSKTFDDGYAPTQRVNFGGVAAIDKNAIKFTTSNAATVKVWWVEGGDNNRQMTILDASGVAVATTAETLAKNATCISTFDLAEAGTYYLGSAVGNNYIFKVEVTETPSGAVKPPRADWANVEAPIITEVALDVEDANIVNVTVKANVGYDGADKVTVVMTDAQGNEIATRNSAAEKTEHTLKFEPENSGTYTFSVKAIRDGEEDKLGAETKNFNFLLPLTTPNIKGAYNVGDGIVEVEWDAVKEAEKYIVSVEGTDIEITTEELIAAIEGLEVGKTYTIEVTAVRGEDTTEATIEKTVADEVETKWYFAAYGSSTNTSSNGYEELEDGSVRVYSTGGKGKIVPGSTDGLAFYYTEIDPATTNFTLSATAHVNKWTLSNGQEGFGMMAADRVGKHGEGTAFWNNAYMAIASKVEYYYDSETGTVTDDTTKQKVSMKLGIGSQEKIGVTADNLAEFEANNTTLINEQFKSACTTLDLTGGKTGATNVVGNGTNVDGGYTDFRFTIQKNNTGYFVSYTDAEGNTTTKKYYDTEALSQIDKDSVYLGFFASRNADITFTDIEFTTITPEDDAPAEERPVTLVTPNFKITSATVANSPIYELTFVGNADGSLVITDDKGNEVVNKSDVKANEKVSQEVEIALGNNKFDVTFTPDADYKPSEYEKLSSYETVEFTHTVTFKSFGEAGDSIYVSPNGKATGNGTKANPLDVYTAVKYVQAGQTIVIMEGTYNLKSTIKVERGINGTADNMIYMVADPEASTRPVFDFGGRCAGMVLAGDYWYFKGFDVTRSADAQKGMQISGNNNIVDQINAYKNGNTGIQISRYLSTDNYEDWPANNLILNCTSYLNADKGYEDADGFAAKLTVGDGNVFDGCIAHHNADDGWDLFAKVQSGCIGAVTIQNSVAYKNGYVLDESGNEINAGNGNGFKMGGDSMSGHHVLKNSIAFFNKAKGIDSNSCPDIEVYDCVSFDNESYNVALYTNTAANTAYVADGVISYRKNIGTGVAEQLKLLGSQDTSKVQNAENYYWDVASKTSKNTEGVTVTDSWFESLEFTTIDRNADGTINTHGFLVLTDEAKTGSSIGGTGSTDVEIGGETDGSIEGNVPEVKPEDGSTDNDSSENIPSDNGASSDDSDSNSSSSTATVVVEKETVTIEEVVTPLVDAPALPAGYTFEQVNISKSGMLRVELLQKYYGQKLQLAAVVNKNVGITFDMQEVNSVAGDMNLTSTMVPVKDFAEGFNTVRVIASERTKLPASATLHYHVGSENVGKIAYIYVLTEDVASYKFVTAMAVNEIGNVAIKTDDFTDVMILIAK
ncbi:MAG: hypothetical protein IJO85_05815 [Lachnospiraceae bacterium]|nr:hypothetical protein [Lachnospiraceae bacterium]